MTKINEKLIRYLAGEMSMDEKNNFESELKNSPLLMKQKNDYQNLFSEIHPSVKSEYFDNIVPDFRKRLEKKSQKARTLRWVYSLSSTAAVVIIIILLIIPGKQKTTIDEVITEMDNSEITRLVEDMQIDVTSAEPEKTEAINEEYINEFSISSGNEGLTELLTDSELYSSITDEEADLIYDQLINKDLLR